MNNFISNECKHIDSDMLINIESMDLMVDEVMEEFLDRHPGRSAVQRLQRRRQGDR